MGKKTKVSSARALRLRRRFDEGAPLAVLASDAGMSASAFLTWRRAQGWPSRAPRLAAAATEHAQVVPPLVVDAAAENAAPSGDPPATGPVDMEAMRRRLARAVEAEIGAVETRLSGTSVAAGERNARLLASLVKTFAELRRLEALEPTSSKRGAADHGPQTEDADAENGPPRDIAMLRHELARTVERIAREGASG